MPIQQLIAPNQNSLIDILATAEQFKNYRATNALAEAKLAAAEREAQGLERLRSAFAAGGDPNDPAFQRGLYAADPTSAASFYKTQAGAQKEQAQTRKYEAETEAGGQEAARKDLEFIARFPGDRGAVLATFGKWIPKMPQLAPIAERLAGIEDPGQFKSEVQGFAMSGLEQMKAARAERNVESQIAYRESMMGKPMVIQTPGGAYAYPQHDPGAATRLPTGPSSAEISEAQRAFEAEQAALKGAADNGYRLPAAIVSKQAEIATDLDTLSSLSSEAQTLDLGGAGYGGEARLEVSRRFPGVTSALGIGVPPADQTWWQTYKTLEAKVRNRLFGASLTTNEQESFERLSVSPNMAATTIRENVAQQQRILERAQARQQQTFSSAGYKVPDVTQPPARGGTSWGEPPPPTLEPGVDPGVTPEQVEAEMRRRGLL